MLKNQQNVNSAQKYNDFTLILSEREHHEGKKEKRSNRLHQQPAVAVGTSGAIYFKPIQ